MGGRRFYFFLCIVFILFPLTGVHGQAASEGRNLEADILNSIDKMNRAIQEKNDPMRNKMYFEFRLIEQSDPGVVAPYLIKNLENDNPGVAEYTAFVLGWIDDKRAIEPMRAMLSGSESRKIAAARALGFMRAEPALPDLITLLDDESSHVRGNAAYALGLMGDDAANAALKKATQDSDELVRYFAEEALKRIEDYKKFGW
ncbi:MAG TPA: HEAT repeat domain-containing protein [bacterium]|nr:HEAT repeat domain-containing protein [bacterium]